MNSMESNFVPYQIALDMKSIGFDEPCFGYYYTLNGKDWEFGENESYNLLDEFYNIGPKFTLIAPLYQQAFRWFREKYNLLGYVSQATISKGKVFMFSCNEGNDTLVEDIDSDFKTYEEAEFVCLKNLIEIVKKNNK